MKKSRMILFNIFAITIVEIFIFLYSSLTDYHTFQSAQFTFENNTTHTMESAEGYMLGCQHLTDSWANYINSHTMTMEEAIDFIQHATTNERVSTHILWNDTYTGLSTVPNPIQTNDYSVQYGTNISEGALYIPTMQATIAHANKEQNTINITNSYTDPVTGSRVVSFVNKISLLDKGEKKDAVLIYALPLSYIKEIWKIIDEHSNTDFALIEKQGTYVIQPASMKNSNFYEFIHSYNSDSKAIQYLKETMLATKSGSFIAYNAKEEKILYSYTELQNNNNFFVVTSIPTEQLKKSNIDWVILWVSSLSLVGLLIINIISFSKNANKQEHMNALLQDQIITIKKQDEQLQESLHAAMVANKSKSAFLFNMSHDIRTPMNAIMGFTDLMAQNLDNKDKLIDYLNKIQLSNETLYSLINNVLELARIESGKTKIKEEPWDLSKLKDVAYALFEDRLNKKHIHLSYSINTTHNIVYCDVTKLQEIFLNIFSNAYKYTREGDSIDLKIEELPCDKQGYATYKTTIRDTGVGMSSDFLNHIFDEFEREHTSTETKIAGSGLGMAIVKRLVELMDGSITVESELNKGSAFTFTLTHRIAKEEDFTAVTNPLHLKDIQLQGHRVLLAEDNELNYEIASSILQSMGLIVDHAPDGKICVEMLTNAPDDYYDLIFMDIQMPTMDGLEATKQIRALHNTKKASIPIIATTANAFDEDKQTALDAGINDHLAKPIRNIELKMILEKYLCKN